MSDDLMNAFEQAGYRQGFDDAEAEAQTKLQSLEAKLAMAREALDGLKNEFGVVFYALCKRDGLGNVPPEHNAFYLAAKKALQSTPEDIKAFIQKVKDEAVREFVDLLQQSSFIPEHYDPMEDKSERNRIIHMDTVYETLTEGRRYE